MTAADTECTCGQCGYCVRGIVSLNCPECGADLRIVGILPPNFRRPLRTTTRMFIWSVALLIAAVPVSILLLNSVLPFTQMQKTTRTIFCQAPYLNRTLDVWGGKLRWQPLLIRGGGTLPRTLMVSDLANRSFLDLDLVTGGFDYTKTNGTVVSKPNSFSSADLAGWFATTGVNTADPQVRSLCDQVYAAIEEIPQGAAAKFTTFSGPKSVPLGVAHPAFTFIVHDEPSPMVVVLLSLFWLSVWIVGLRKIHHKRNSAQTTGVVASAATGGG